MLMSSISDCVDMLHKLELKVEANTMRLSAIEVLMNNQANILKYVVTPLIVGVFALSGITNVF